MLRMKDLDRRLEGLEQWNQYHAAAGKSIGEGIDDLLHLMQDMVKLEAKIEKMEEGISERLKRMEAAQVDSSKLVDRLIEMSLVSQGQGREASIHRSQSRLENDFSNPQSWAGDEVPEDVWPPPGCDSMDIRG